MAIVVSYIIVQVGDIKPLLIAVALSGIWTQLSLPICHTKEKLSVNLGVCYKVTNSIRHS